MAPKGLLPRPPRAAARGGAPRAEAQSKVKISKRKNYKAKHEHNEQTGKSKKIQDHTEENKKTHENT